MQRQTFQVGVSRIEAVVGGAGRTVVILPGLGRDVGYLSDFCRRLAASGCRTVAVNPRGAAGSTGPSRGVTLHDLAADIAGVIESLGDAPVVVIGSAFGQRVARCLAADRPELVQALILLAAGGRVRDGRRPPGGTGPGRYPRLPAWRRAARSLRRRLTRSHRRGVWPAALAIQTRATRATSVDAWWLAGGADMLVIQGLKDHVAPPENGRLLKEQLGDRVQLIELPEAGHRLVERHPDQVLAAVIDFLDQRSDS